MTKALTIAIEVFGVEFFENCKKNTVVIQDKKSFTKDYIKSYMLLLSK